MIKRVSINDKQDACSSDPIAIHIADPNVLFCDQHIPELSNEMR